MNAGLSTGNTLVHIPKFTPEAFFRAIQNYKATVFASVPTMYLDLLNYNDKEKEFDFDLISKTLRIGVSGGASLPLEIIREMEKKYNIPILEGYGLSKGVAMNRLNH